MSIPGNFEKFKGLWSGTNRLHTTWIKENPVHESISEAAIDFAARGKFIKFEYDWIYEDERQEGLLLVSQEKDAEKIRAVWIDSWHNGDRFMTLDGGIENGVIELKGFYAVPDHPDWGWRITVEAKDENSFRITMLNISPDGDEDLAVEIVYGRKT